MHETMKHRIAQLLVSLWVLSVPVAVVFALIHAQDAVFTAVCLYLIAVSGYCVFGYKKPVKYV